MRAFLALPLSGEARSGLYRQTAELRRRYPRLKWTSRENLHVTLLFLGEIDRPLAGQVAGLLGAAELPGAYRAEWRGLGTFPLRGEPRVIFAGMEKGAEQTEALYYTLLKALTPLAARLPLQQEKPFYPHITLGRVKRGGLKTKALEGRHFPTGEFPVERLVLYESELLSGGPRYREFAAFAL